MYAHLCKQIGMRKSVAIGYERSRTSRRHPVIIPLDVLLASAQSDVSGAELNYVSVNVAKYRVGSPVRPKPIGRPGLRKPITAAFRILSANKRQPTEQDIRSYLMCKKMVERAPCDKTIRKYIQNM